MNTQMFSLIAVCELGHLPQGPMFLRDRELPRSHLLFGKRLSLLDPHPSTLGLTEQGSFYSASTEAGRNLLFLFCSSILAPEPANLFGFFFVFFVLSQFSRDLSFFLGVHSGSKALSGHTCPHSPLDI